MTRQEKNKKKKVCKILQWIGYIIIGICASMAISAMVYITVNEGHLSEGVAHKMLPYGFGCLMAMVIGLVIVTITWKYETDFKLYKQKILVKKESIYATQFMKYFHEMNLEKANFFFDLLKYEATKNTMIGFIRGTLYGKPDKEKSDEILRGFYEKTYIKK